MKDVFNMLACAQGAYSKIGAGTEVEAFDVIPYRYFIRIAGSGIINFKVGKNRMATGVFYPELLFNGKLTAKSRLPFINGHVVRLPLIWYPFSHTGVFSNVSNRSERLMMEGGAFLNRI